MGIFDALTTAVSGLGAQAYALQNISGNIANSQTTAYKRINTSFEDLIGDNLPSKQIAGGVLASSVPTNNVQGDVQAAQVATHGESWRPYRSIASWYLWRALDL